MAGKNKIERGIRFSFDDNGAVLRDLSADLVPGSLTAGGLSFEEAEMTGVSEAQKNFLAGHAESEVTAQFYFNDTAVTGAHTVFKDKVGKVGTLQVDFGSSGAAPITGDPRWSGEYVCLAAPVGLAGNKPVINARFKPGDGTGGAWSTVP